jgi:hypothetical protein
MVLLNICDTAGPNVSKIKRICNHEEQIESLRVTCISCMIASWDRTGSSDLKCLKGLEKFLIDQFQVM